MALKYSGERLYDFEGNEIIPSIVQIEKAERRLSDKKQTLDDLQNEYELLEHQAFETYKNNVRYDTIPIDIIKQANKWKFMLKIGEDSEGHKLDKRKSYREKECYIYLIKLINELFDINVDDVSIIEYNFGEAQNIEFQFAEIIWVLSLPDLNKIRFLSYQRYGASIFKLKLSYYSSKSFTKVVGSTFDENELKDIMARGIENVNKQ